MNHNYTVLGIDPSMNNWGFAKGIWNLHSNKLEIKQLGIYQHKLDKSDYFAKSTRKNNKDLKNAENTFITLQKAVNGVDFIFVEVPIGSQKARAAIGCGMTLGLLGALRATGVTFFEIYERDVKKHLFGKISVDKNETRKLMYSTFPDANWPVKNNNQLHLGKAEHIADACATLVYGVESTEFKQILSFIKK